MEEGRVEYVLVSIPCLSTPGPAICVFPQESPRRGKLVEALLRDASKLQVPLNHLNNIVKLRIWVLVPLWTVSNPAGNQSAGGETGELLLFSMVDCHD